MPEIEIRDGYAYYPCGCKFKVIDIGPPVRLHFEPKVDAEALRCPRTWQLFADGNTKGIFQLETRFGQQYSKKLGPINIEQLAALTAILRPGCIQAQRDGKTVTDHYIDRKNDAEEVTYVHPALEPILSETYGEMIYQEQAMKIAQVIAGFDLQQADTLRKAIGKKKPEMMAKVRVEFINGCRKTGIVDEETAEAIFNWIEKSQRYSFNKSHAVSYAINAYLSAYAKAHFPVSFFTSYLYFAKDKQKKFDEIKLLVANAKVMGIRILPPDFRHTNKHFKRMTDQQDDEAQAYSPSKDRIHFGFADIKGVGDAAITKLNTAIYQVETAIQKHRKDWSWAEFLVYFSQEINSITVTGMIESGALSYFKLSRQQMLFEYEQFSTLTNKEQAWLKQYIKLEPTDRLVQILSKMMKWYDEDKSNAPKPCANKNRVTKVNEIIELLKHPPFSLIDSPEWISRVEEARLGISLTASSLDACIDIDQANCTCLEFLKHQNLGSGMLIAVQIDDIKEHVTQKGDPMAFITVSDQTATLDCVVFAGDWEYIRQSGVCVEENTVIIGGDRSRQNPSSLIIKKMWQLT